MAKYKLQVLQQADACTAQGEIGALLRREGLYSSHLSSCRRLRESDGPGRFDETSAEQAREGVAADSELLQMEPLFVRGVTDSI